MKIVPEYYVEFNLVEDKLDIKNNYIVKLDEGEDFYSDLVFPPLSAVKSLSKRLRQIDVFPACQDALLRLSDETREIVKLAESGKIGDILKITYYIERDISKVDDHETQSLLRTALYGHELVSCKSVFGGTV